MKMDLYTLCEKVEATTNAAVALPDEENTQVIVRFTNRPDVEINLLTPYAQMQIRGGHIDHNVLVDLLESVRRIAGIPQAEKRVQFQDKLP